MYDNIGGKIKVLARVAFFVEAIAAGIVGIVLMASYDDGILVGFLVAVGGGAVALFSSWLLYGFGEIIDRTCDIARNACGGLKKSEAQSKVDCERISKIEKLRSQGLITEDEYLQAISKEQ